MCSCILDHDFIGYFKVAIALKNRITNNGLGHANGRINTAKIDI